MSIFQQQPLSAAESCMAVQRSMATCLRCGQMFNNHSTANVRRENLSVKEF